MFENTTDNLDTSQLEDLLTKCNLSSFFSDKNEGINFNLN